MKIIALLSDWAERKRVAKYIELIEMQLGGRDFARDLHFTILVRSLVGNNFLQRVTHTHRLRLGQVPDAEGCLRALQDKISGALAEDKFKVRVG